MTITLKAPELRELKPRIIVCGVGGGGCNAVNNMITSGLSGVDFLVANTDAQALTSSRADRVVQMGLQVTEGLGAGAQPEIGRAAAEEAREEIREHLAGSHMCFVTAGMGGGTGTGAAPVIAMIAREMGILTVGVVTKPFDFEGQRRKRIADTGISELSKCVDTLIVIPNQNLFRIATEKTTFADAFAMADQVLFSGVASVTDLMVKEGLINLDFADVRSIMRNMGKAMMGTGEASGERRAILSAEAAIANPLLDEVSMKGAHGLLISITGGHDLTLYEVDEAASRIRQEVDEDANIILGATFDSSLEGVIRVSVVATGIDNESFYAAQGGEIEARAAEMAVERLRAQLAQQSQKVAQERAGSPLVRAAVTPVAAPVVSETYAAAPAHNDSYGEFAEEQPVSGVEEEDDYSYEVQREAVVAPPAFVAPAREAAPRAAREEAYDHYAAESAPRPARMPTIEDFPRPGQEQLRQARGEANPAEARRRSLFDRIAAFGASRQEEAYEASLTEPAAPRPPRSQQPPAQQPSPAHAEYAKRVSAQANAAALRANADLQGRRPAPAARNVEEDHLDIPAFLRRQAHR
ncbi:cell division protein FtsZ [Methylocystis bryophila]|uniref:Cell division protein FtsZ n=1 Tax=Methylocystis bryophila TaxID=655015 RepID=A0A1W6MQI4_9HYPH|nr:cell division protein FtsZ [Methylocystis bryophila]ARN79861.1 cell division protein FtsZ [Methylocystis bryophila]BDV39750.1 cell division protein FtsZ [Methylocystis bryophila]